MLLLVLYFALIDMTVISGYPQCVQQIHVKTLCGFMSTQGGLSRLWIYCHFVGFAVHRLIYNCSARRFKCFTKGG